jgi:lipopolysaccharide transport system ATP-binding protein
VGDAGFQRKCIGSIRETTRSGRTALIVSHNMAFVRALCSRVILLSRGKVLADGSTDEVISRYHEVFRSGDMVYRPQPAAEGSQRTHISEARLRDSQGRVTSEVPCGEALSVEVDVSLPKGESIPRPWIAVRLYTAHGDLLAHIANREAGREFDPISEPRTISCHLPRPGLLPGEYFIGLVLADANRREYDVVERAFAFTVTQADVFGSGLPPTSRHGSLLVESSWALAETRSDANAPASAPGTEG